MSTSFSCTPNRKEQVASGTIYRMYKIQVLGDL